MWLFLRAAPTSFGGSRASRGGNRATAAYLMVPSWICFPCATRELQMLAPLMNEDKLLSA